MIRLALADDNRLMQQTIVEKLSFYPAIVLKIMAGNGEELLEKLEKNPRIDLILMDIEMPKMNGIDATFVVKQRFPHIKIIMLTVFDNDEHIFRAIKAGADGYLLKETSPEELHRAITETMNGGASMTPSIALKTLRMFREPVDFSKTAENEAVKLTPRETEVLQQLGTGLKYAQIAANLNISTGTVRKHIENIYARLQAGNKLEALRKAKDSNLI